MDSDFYSENAILHLNNTLLPMVSRPPETWEIQIFHKCHKNGLYWPKLPQITLGTPLCPLLFNRSTTI